MQQAPCAAVVSDVEDWKTLRDGCDKRTTGTAGRGTGMCAPLICSGIWGVVGVIFRFSHMGPSSSGKVDLPVLPWNILRVSTRSIGDSRPQEEKETL